MKQLKWYWHANKDVLLQPIRSHYKDAIEYIKEITPDNEIELRLKLFKPVKKQIPDKIIKAWNNFYNMSKYYDEMRERWRKNKITLEDMERIRNTYKKAWNNYCRIINSSPEAISFHTKECPNCSWIIRLFLRK